MQPHISIFACLCTLTLLLYSLNFAKFDPRPYSSFVVVVIIIVVVIVDFFIMASVAGISWGKHNYGIVCVCELIVLLIAFLFFHIFAYKHKPSLLYHSWMGTYFGVCLFWDEMAFLYIVFAMCHHKRAKLVYFGLMLIMLMMIGMMAMMIVHEHLDFSFHYMRAIIIIVGQQCFYY